MLFNLPIELYNIIMLYNSSPLADMIKDEARVANLYRTNDEDHSHFSKYVLEIARSRTCAVCRRIFPCMDIWFVSDDRYGICDKCTTVAHNTFAYADEVILFLCKGFIGQDTLDEHGIQHDIDFNSKEVEQTLYETRLFLTRKKRTINVDNTFDSIYTTW